MRSLVLFGVLCVAAVKASNYIPVYGEQYVRPGLQYPYVTIPSTSYRPYPYGLMPGYSLALAGAPVTGVASVAPTASALSIAPAAPAVVAPRPLAPGAPGGVIFTGTGEVSAAGTGLGFFSGEGEVQAAGVFPAGVFMGEGQAQFDGSGQIQVSTVPGVGVVGSVQDFAGQAGFQGRGTVAAVGTGVVNAQGTGTGGLFGNGLVNVNGVGLTTINALRGGRSYDVPAVSTYGPVYPSHGYSTYGSLYNGGYFPGSYGTYRLIRPAPVAGTSGTTYGPVYPSNGYSTYSSLYNEGRYPRSYGTYRLIRPAPVAGTYGTTYGPVYGNTYAPRYYH